MEQNEKMDAGKGDNFTDENAETEKEGEKEPVDDPINDGKESSESTVDDEISKTKVEEMQLSQDSETTKEEEMQLSQGSEATDEEEETPNWSTLEDFGYHFNSSGQLRDIKTDKPFEFNVYKSRSANQKRYERLGEVIEHHVYKLLEDEGGLLRTAVPIDASNNEPATFIFRSEDSFTCSKLLLLIHGSGAVRAGQWARRLIINHSLESGTQLPYIKKARSLGFGVLVLNTNYNCDKETRERIRGSCSPEDHFIYVWEHFVLKSQAEHVAIVAHSYGGVVTTRTAAEFPIIMRKTFAVAFTDSVHYRVKSRNQRFFNEWMRNNVCNWASSSERLDTPLSADAGDCRTVSAGTSVHEETSWKAFNSVWKFVQKRWKKVAKNESASPTSTSPSSKSPVGNENNHEEPGTKKSKADDVTKDNDIQAESLEDNAMHTEDSSVHDLPDSSDVPASVVDDVKSLTEDNLEKTIGTDSGGTTD